MDFYFVNKIVQFRSWAESSSQILHDESVHEILVTRTGLVFLLSIDALIFSFLQVLDDNTDSVSAVVRKRLTSDDPDLTKEERLKIRQFLEAFPDGEQ